MTAKAVTMKIEALQEAMTELKEMLGSSMVKLKEPQAENSELRTRVENLEEYQSENKELRARVEKMEAQKKSFTEKLSFAEKLKENLKATPEPVVTVKTVTDIQDRRRNLIFRGIEESYNPEGSRRKEYDENQVLKVMKMAGMKPALFQEAMLTVRRLGKKEDGKHYRPILVKLSSQEVREKALILNKNLKDINRENKDNGRTSRYRIDPDLSKEQMANLDRMWEAANERTKAKNGLKFYVVGKENPTIRSRELAKEEMSKY